MKTDGFCTFVGHIARAGRMVTFVKGRLCFDNVLCIYDMNEHTCSALAVHLRLFVYFLFTSIIIVPDCCIIKYVQESPY